MQGFRHQVTLMFSRPGRLTDNAYIESFNRSFRDECLNPQWFLSWGAAQNEDRGLESEHNEGRPHTALNHLSQARVTCPASFKTMFCNSIKYSEAEVVSPDSP